MQFRIGQRVKWVARHFHDDVPLGTTGTVVPPFRWAQGDEVSVRADFCAAGDCNRYAKPFQLAPLTDPKADAFLESIRKMKPYSEPVVEKQRQLIDRIESVIGPLGPGFK